MRFFFNSAKICTPVSDLCYTWNEAGACLSCYGGYVLNANGACLINPAPFVPSADSLCKVWTAKGCEACAERSFFDA